MQLLEVQKSRVLPSQHRGNGERSCRGKQSISGTKKHLTSVLESTDRSQVISGDYVGLKGVERGGAGVCNGTTCNGHSSSQAISTENIKPSVVVKVASKNGG